MEDSYSYDSSVYENGVTSSGSEAAMMSGFYIALGIALVVSYVIYALFLSMIFKKAGEQAWKAWVPVYNQWVFLELGGQKGWLALLSLLGAIPLLGIIPALVAYVYSAIAAYKIGLNLGKEGVFVLLYIFLPLVWVIWLGVDKTAVWKGAGSQSVTPSTEPAPAQFGQPATTDNTTPPTTPSQPTAP